MVGKRFMDTSIWERPWFMDLGVADKMAVMYLFAKCDAVGVWVPNYKLANFQLGADVDWDALPEKCNGNIEVLANGKWWLKDFCEFQYGALREECKPHASYLSLLRKHGLEGYPKGMHTLKEKETEKEKEEELEKEKELYHAVDQAFLSRNDGRFTNYGKEGKAIHGIIDKAKARNPDDPAALVKAMLDAFWRLKQSGDKFYSAQPFLPSALNAAGIWDRVLETMRTEVVDPEIMAIIKGGAA